MSSPLLASRLENIVCGWKGQARGQALADLHRECLGAAAGVGADLVPAALQSVRGLDRDALKQAARSEFRAAASGRFDCALVPRNGRGGGKEWLFVIEAELPLPDQVALYGHAIGHLLLNRDAVLLGQPLPLNVREGRAHADALAELRLLENTRDLLNRRVLDRFPRLAQLLVPRQWPGGAVAANLRERIASSEWPTRLLDFSHDFTPGRVFLTPEGPTRGRKSRVDVLLRAEASLPMAVAFALRPRQNLEAAAQHLIHTGREQMGLPFGFLIEEDGPIHEFDWTPGQDATTRRAQFPSRDELLNRFLHNFGINDENARDTLLYPYTPTYLGSRRYYQEAAINRAVVAVLQAKRGLRDGRILLNLATGTGKTPVAAQIAWKLKRTRAVRNILFLTDRDFLVMQAQDNHFERFGDARARIMSEKITARDVLFSTYQALMGDKDRPALYVEYPPNWFDLIFIDECHRGSAADDSNWRKILEHFGSAIQIGMTATPLKADNAQTYDYFGAPISTYSLRQGINDGFLAPYQVRRVEIGEENLAREATDSVDRAMLKRLPLVSSRTLEDATPVIAKHLCAYLRQTDPLAKTIVFCTDQEHAAAMREAIEKQMPESVAQFPDYATRITADDSSEGKRALSRFCHVEETSPVVVTTSRLLSTGVDVETCKNVVIARPIGSFVEFKQILGRGTRLREPLKMGFTLIDYAGSVKHFFDPDFDGDPEAVSLEILAPQIVADENAPSGEATIAGEAIAAGEAGAVPVVVISSDENPALVEALVEQSPQEPPVDAGDETSAHENAWPPIVAADDGAPQAQDVAVAPAVVAAPTDAAGRSQLPVPEVARTSETAPTPMAPASAVVPPGAAIQTTTAGRQYAVAGEWIYELAPDGVTLRALRYSDYAREALQSDIADEATLRERWMQRESRTEMLAVLRDEGVHLSSLALSVGAPTADSLDLLAHVLFDAPLLTRDQRAAAFRARHETFLTAFEPQARATLEAVLEKYRAGAADDLCDPEILKMLAGADLPKPLAMIQAFGGGDAMRAALAETEKRLYA